MERRSGNKDSHNLDVMGSEQTCAPIPANMAFSLTPKRGLNGHKIRGYQPYMWKFKFRFGIDANCSSDFINFLDIVNTSMIAGLLMHLLDYAAYARVLLHRQPYIEVKE